MKHVKYDEIPSRYSEVEIFKDQKKALFYECRISREDFPSDMYIYDIRHCDETGDPCTVEKRVVVDFYGSIITHKPIDLGPNGYLDIDAYNEFEFTDNYVEPSKVREWVDKMKSADNNSNEVLTFIDNFIMMASTQNIDEQSFMSVFRSGYCYYFANMLKEAFGRGEVYITAPLGHIVWRDIDNRYYDIEGEYFFKDHDVEAMVPITYGKMAEDFKCIPGVHEDATKEEIEAAVKEYLYKFPNV